MLFLRKSAVTWHATWLAMIGLLVIATTASAVNLSWDPTLSGSVYIGGSGTWDVSTTANWYDGASDNQWTDITGTADTAIFAGDQGGTVTIASNPLGALGVQFGTPGYTVAGTLLTLGASGTTVNNVVQGTSSITAPVSLAGNQTWSVAGASSLIAGGAISGSDTLSKSGNGALTLSGANTSFTGGTTLNSGGRLNIGHADALGTGAGTLNFSGTTAFDNTSGGAITLPGNRAITIGNAVVTYFGSNDLNLGNGAVTSSASRTLVVRGSNLTIGGAIDLQAAGRNFTKQGAGTLTLTSNAHKFDQTLIQGGTIDLSTTGQLPQGFAGGTPQQLTLNNGELRMSGTSAGNRSETVGTLSIASGRDTLSLAADPASNTSFTAASIGNRAIYSTILFRGTNLGTATSASQTAGTSNIVLTTAPTPTAAAVAATTFGATGSGVSNSTQAAIFHGGLYDASATGNGAGFATYESGIGVRALNSSEQATAYPGAASSDNIRLDLAAATAITGVQTNSLQLNNVSGSAQIVTNSGTALNPVNGLLFSGDSAITLTGGTFTYSTTGGDGVILSTNTAGVTIASAITISGSGERGWTFGGPGNITVTGAVGGPASNGGVAVNGPGTVTLDAAITVSSKGLIAQGGTIKLGSNFSMSSTRSWRMANGATIDVNGKSVATNLEGLSSNDIAGSSNGAGGTIINSSATPATLTFTPSGSSRSSGTSVTGDISLVMAATGASTQTLTGQSTYTGTTTINSGTIALGTHNALPVGTALAVNGHATVGAVLNLAGFSQTVGSLSGSTAAVLGNIQNSTGSSVFTVDGSSSTSFGGVLGGGAGTLAFVKAGSGSQAFTGANTYNGVTLVNGGTLVVDGSHSGTGAYTVNPSGTLSGIGTIAAPVTFLGKLAPGTSPGTLTINNSVTFYPASTMAYDLLGSDPSVSANNDLLKGVTTLTLDGTLSVTDVSPGSFATANAGDKWTLITYSGTLIDNGLALGSMPALGAGKAFAIDTGTSGSIFLTIVVPEASSFLAVGIVALGCGGVTFIRKRRAADPADPVENC